MHLSYVVHVVCMARMCNGGVRLATRVSCFLSKRANNRLTLDGVSKQFNLHCWTSFELRSQILLSGCAFTRLGAPVVVVSEGGDTMDTRFPPRLRSASFTSESLLALTRTLYGTFSRNTLSTFSIFAQTSCSIHCEGFCLGRSSIDSFGRTPES